MFEVLLLTKIPLYAIFLYSSSMLLEGNKNCVFSQFTNNSPKEVKG